MKVVLVSLALFVTLTMGFDRWALVQSYNKLRSEYATKHQIANMNELIYEPKLESKLQEFVELDKGCSHRHIKEYKNFQILNAAENDDSYIRSLIVEDLSRTKMAFFEHFCNDENTNEHSYMVDYDRNIQIIHGEPGSKCPEDRKFNKRGLCGAKKYPK